MKGIAITLMLVAGCLLLPLHVNDAAALSEEKTTSSQAIDLQRIGTQMDRIQDQAAKRKAMGLLTDHQDLLAKYKNGGIDNLIRHGLLEKSQKESPTPKFQVKNERGDATTTIIIFPNGSVNLSRPDIEISVDGRTAQICMLLHRMGEGVGRIVMWDQQGRITKNEIVKDPEKIDGKSLNILWPAMPDKIDAIKAGDQKNKIELTYALVRDALKYIQSVKDVTKFNPAVVGGIWAEVDGWDQIAKIKFSVFKKSGKLRNISIYLLNSEIDHIFVQFDPLIIDERMKDGRAVWGFRCDQAGKVISVSKKP
jgi:hypothetical protein